MWLFNGLDNEDVFLKIFRKRLNNCTYPTWNNQIQTQTSVYFIFYSKNSCIVSLDYIYRFILFPFQCSIHNILKETEIYIFLLDCPL